MLRAKHGNEVLVAEFRLRAVGRDVMLERGSALHIHVARVPLVSECRNRIHAPVDEDAELGVAKPLGDAIGGERIPVGAERAVTCGGVEAGNLCLRRLVIAIDLLSSWLGAHDDNECKDRYDDACASHWAAKAPAVHDKQTIRRGRGLRHGGSLLYHGELCLSLGFCLEVRWGVSPACPVAGAELP